MRDTARGLLATVAVLSEEGPAKLSSLRVSRRPLLTFNCAIKMHFQTGAWLRGLRSERLETPSHIPPQVEYAPLFDVERVCDQE